MRAKNNILFYLALLAIAINFSCKKEKKNQVVQPAISSNVFIQDSIWFKTYRNLNNDLLRPKIFDVLKSVSDSTNVHIADIGLFNMLVQNYDCNNLTVAEFQVKYPFAKSTFVEDNFDQLVKIELFNKNENSYQLSERGKLVLQTLKNNYESTDVSEIKTNIISILKEVSKNALSSNFAGINKSLKNCQKASLRFDNSNNKFLQLMTVMNDLVALRNDQSHYRYSFFKYKPFRFSEELNHPMIELLAGISHNQEFTAKKYLSRPTWGYTEKETKAYLDFLIHKNLVRQNDSTYALTNEALEIEKKASNEYETHFYQPWLFLSQGDYEKLKTELL